MTTGDLLVLLVHDPAGAQELLGGRRVPSELWEGASSPERSDLLCSLARSFDVPVARGRGFESVFVTVVPRQGLTVVDSHDAEVFSAWRYSNHCTGALDTTLLLVTEHGWLDALSGRGGAEPRWDGRTLAEVGRVVPLPRRRAR